MSSQLKTATEATTTARGIQPPLSRKENCLRQFFNYTFSDGVSVKGHKPPIVEMSKKLYFSDTEGILKERLGLEPTTLVQCVMASPGPCQAPMGDEEEATLDGQFEVFAKLMEPKTRDGSTINLYRMDYWFRQAKVLDDRKVTMTDTGIIFNRYCKSEIDFDEFLEVLEELAMYKQLDIEKLHETLTNCGLPGQSAVEVPSYRDYFKTYKPKSKMAMS